MARRPCLICGTPTDGSRCPLHQLPGSNRTHRNVEERRANYGAKHRAARKALATQLPAPCWYCGLVIATSDPWVAAHVTDGDPNSPRVHAHPACNQRARRR